MRDNIKNYIENITEAQLAQQDAPTMPEKDDDAKLLAMRTKEIQAVLRENGEIEMSGTTTQALAAFISALPTEELMEIALLHAEVMPMPMIMPHTSGGEFENNIAAFANVAAKTLLDDGLTSLSVATWGAFLKVVLASDKAQEVFENLVVTMPSGLYSELFKDFVTEVKQMTGND